MEEINEFIEKLSEERRKANCLPEAQSHYIGGQLGYRDQMTSLNTTQWSIHEDGKFIATGPTTQKLPAGAYKVDMDNNGNIIFTAIKVVTDELLRFTNTTNDKVLESINIFWNSRDKFKLKKQIFKRGILLWGLPGSGKTCTINLLSQDIISRDGIVIICENPRYTILALAKLRIVEPLRNVICILEDLDEIIERYGESEILALLDGHNQIDNICYVASTNYPEQLDERIANRPSRFDEVIKIGMPSVLLRRAYLRSKLSEEELDDIQLEKWLNDTDGMSIAHLKELFVSVFCLSKKYDEIISRLKAMKKKIKSGSNMSIGMIGSN